MWQVTIIFHYFDFHFVTMEKCWMRWSDLIRITQNARGKAELEPGHLALNLGPIVCDVKGFGFCCSSTCVERRERAGGPRGDWRFLILGSNTREGHLAMNGKLGHSSSIKERRTSMKYTLLCKKCFMCGIGSPNTWVACYITKN